ncbi:MAG: hypothetical protein CMH83_17150 [Nocardioides sp.]|nr:hypothetical protein [Nocardioides sp.]
MADSNQRTGADGPEVYRQTGHLVGGVTTITGCVLVLVATYVYDRVVPVELVALAMLVAVLVWLSMVRPSAVVDGDELVLHRTLSSVRIPVLAVLSVDVRQVLVVHVGERRYTCSAVGRSRRKLRTEGGSPVSDAAALSGQASYGALVEGRLRAIARDTRQAAGLSRSDQLALADRVRVVPGVVEGVALLGATAFLVLALAL